MAFGDLLAAVDKAARQILGGLVRYAPQPQFGDAVDVQGIFDAPDARGDVGQAGVMSSGPMVFLRMEDLPTDPEGEDEPTVTVDGVDYKVGDVKKDGQGGVTLYLHQA